MIKKSIDIGGRELSLEIGKFAKQASGAAMVRCGDTMVLATVVASPVADTGKDYFPLQVEYREKISAAGKIPGGFLKREGRPSEKEVLTSRLIDRPIRPMFPENFRNETQIMVTVYSSDQENDGDVLGAVGASTALMISNIPFDGPIAEVRVGRNDGRFIINPTFAQLGNSDLDVTLAGTMTSIVMVEGEAKEISEADMLAALKFAHPFIRTICELQIQIRDEIGLPKMEVVPKQLKTDLVPVVEKHAAAKLREITRRVLKKEERSERNGELLDSLLEALKTEAAFGEVAARHASAGEALSQADFLEKHLKLVKEIVHDIEYREMREMILSDGKRLDGRGVRDIRPIACEIGLLPRTHGSSLFQRGETQSLTTVTLGTKMDEQILDGLLPETTKRFMLHYNFPPFSVGEVGRLGFTGRREIGHGNLAERSLKNMLPVEFEFPYTVRIVSDILESNGSSSMATVCAGSLSLMDAGVPLKKPVAGIAMGLIKEGDRVSILSDILGNEDYLGDMDFKVAGTADGITAFQMDIKIQGISFDIFGQALEQAKAGRLHILGVMNQTIRTPRADLSPYAPRLTTIKIPVEMIGAVIGPGGKVIRQIVKDTGAEINIEDDGTVVIASVTSEGAEKALAIINKIIEIPEVGKVYRGKVVRIMDFGAFVEILPGKDGLVHISQLSLNRVEKVTDVVNIGDAVDVKLVQKDDEGRYNLSMKVLLPGYDEATDPTKGIERRPPRRDGGRDRRG
ncbi:MAG TPA: polyribonucleotide nucleotidyltransferase, partial [Bacteroidota bacterium]|nr:polyribonucleotide nucleotidyltransferase [Bacteroidota bacterium]